MGVRIKQETKPGKLGQVAMEFVFFVVFTFMIFVIFGFVIREQLVHIGAQEDEVMLKDVTGMIQQEINTAMGVSDGYTRSFYVPTQINYKEYNLSIINDYLSGKVEVYDVEIRIAHVEGNILKGNNTISKMNSIVYLN